MHKYANSSIVVPTFPGQAYATAVPTNVAGRGSVWAEALMTGSVPWEMWKETDSTTKTHEPSYTVEHGDCIELLRSYPANSVNLVLTDPPYIANYQDRSGRKVANDDNDLWLTPAFREVFRVLANDSFCISFYGWTQTDRFFAAWRSAGFRIVGHITFPKRYTSTVRMLRYQHESAYLLAKGRPNEPENVIGDVIDWGAYTGNKLHPTQKPLSILLPLIQSFSKPGDVVLDPFCGSGSTLAAALISGRRSKGIELSKEMAAVAIKRLERMSKTDARWG